MPAFSAAVGWPFEREGGVESPGAPTSATLNSIKKSAVFAFPAVSWQRTKYEKVLPSDSPETMVECAVPPVEENVLGIVAKLTPALVANLHVAFSSVVSEIAVEVVPEGNAVFGDPLERDGGVGGGGAGAARVYVPAVDPATFNILVSSGFNASEVTS
ncbi:MAG TPA: hypothetical protein DIS53_00350 [Candidatus Wildermuthbacteria bacterium]|nr:hypothetical protein [Candidatus Wildermuthbacteria bacterium]